MVLYRGPKAEVFIERGCAVASLSHARGYVFVVGRGTAVWDVDGNRCPDFSGGVAATSIGYSHPEVIRLTRIRPSGSCICPARILLPRPDRRG